jgi:hypothetical protein
MVKIGKIALWILYAGLAAGLIGGGVYRTQSRLDVVSADGETRSGTGIGSGGEGQGQNQGQRSGDRQGTGIGAGGDGQSQNQGEGRRDGEGQGGQGQNQGSGGQGNGGQGQNQGSDGQGSGDQGQNQGGGGQGQGGGGNGQDDWNGQNRDDAESITAADWLTESGEALEVSADLLLVDTGSGDMLIEGRAWRFALEEGFEIQVGDSLQMSGFWEDGEFKPGVIENQSTGETVTLRDPDGRPLWSGNRG